MRAGEHLRDLRHHVGQQKHHDQQRHTTDDGRVQRGGQQLGAHLVRGFQVLGELQQHLRQTAALLARAYDRHIQCVEFARVHGQRLRQRRAGVDLGAHLGQQIAFGRCVGLFAERAQRAL